MTVAPSAQRLTAALRDAGLTCVVEGQGAIAILLADGPDMVRLADESLRRIVVDIARDHGFFNVALELGDDGA